MSQDQSATTNEASATILDLTDRSNLISQSLEPLPQDALVTWRQFQYTTFTPIGNSNTYIVAEQKPDSQPAYITITSAHLRNKVGIN